MNRIRRIGAALATLAGALFALAAASPALAGGSPTPGPADYITPGAEPPGWHPPLPPGHIVLPSGHIVGPVDKRLIRIPIHTVVTGGMPGWQITLIAASAAVTAAAVAVLVDRWRMARKAHPTTA